VGPATIEQGRRNAPDAGLFLQAAWKGFRNGNSGGGLFLSKSTVEESQNIKIQSDVCCCHPGSPLHSASVEKPWPPAGFSHLTPIGF